MMPLPVHSGPAASGKTSFVRLFRDTTEAHDHISTALPGHSGDASKSVENLHSTDTARER